MSSKRHYQRHIPVILGTLVVASFGGLAVWLISDFIASDVGPPKRAVQQITLLAPPPPPPPPPKIEEPPPEQEIEEEVEIPEPEAMEDLPDTPSDEPLASDLGLDAEGSAGGDAFGLIGRKGGRGLLSAGAFGWYSKQLQNDIHKTLYKEKEIRKQRYSVVAMLWISSEGFVERAELQKGSGRKELDDSITTALLAVHLDQAPPLEMPQPVRIRISSR